MIRKIYLQPGLRLSFGDSPFAREHKLTCKDGIILGASSDGIEIEAAGKKTMIPFDNLEIEEDEEGMYLGV